MRKIIFLLLILAVPGFACAFSSKESAKPGAGDEIVIASFTVLGESSISLRMEKMKYDPIYGGKDFRSQNPTEWRAVLKTESGEVLDSAWLKVREEKRASHSDKTAVPPKWSRVVFKKSLRAHKVEIYFKDVLNASALISSAL